MKFRPPAEGAVEVSKPEAKHEPKELPLVRGNRCVCPKWNAYQNRMLADGKYTYEELWPVNALCLFDAWDQAHEEDSRRHGGNNMEGAL
jgi:hypothetical protein